MNDEILSKFCDDSGLRPAVAAPFIQDGYKYATDGHIGVRIKCEGENTEGAPKIQNVWIEASTIQKWCRADLSTIEFPQLSKGRECVWCHGDGYEECNLGHEHTCEQCAGEGVLGRVTESGFPIHVKLGLSHVSAWLVKKILESFPNAEFSAETDDTELQTQREANPSTKAIPIPWRCGEVEGVLMPVFLRGIDGIGLPNITASKGAPQ